MIKEKEHRNNYIFHITESEKAISIIRNGFTMKPLRHHNRFDGYSSVFGDESVDKIFAAYFYDDLRSLSGDFRWTYKRLSLFDGKSRSVIFVPIQELKIAGFLLYDDFYETGKPITNFTMAVSSQLNIIPGDIFRFLAQR